MNHQDPNEDAGFVHRLDAAVRRLVDAMHAKTMNGFHPEFARIPGAARLSPDDDADGSGIRPFLETLTGRVFAPWRDLPEPQSIRRLKVNVRAARDRLGPARRPSEPPPTSNLAQRLPSVLSRQADGLALTVASLEAYAILIRQAQRDLVALVSGAAEAVDAIDCWGSEIGKYLVIHVFTDALGLERALKDVPTSIAVDKPETVRLGATGIDGVWDSLCRAESMVAQRYARGERCIGDVLMPEREGLAA